MPKPKTRGASRGRVEQTVDGMAELQSLAMADRANGATAQSLEEDALRRQRETFNRIKGIEDSRASAPEDEALALMGEDEERGDRESEDEVFSWIEEDEEERLVGSDEPDEDEEPEQEPDSEDDAEEDDDELQDALAALRRLPDAPDWVFRQPRSRILQLARSMAGWQAGHTRLLSKKDDRIRELEAGAADSPTSKQTPQDLAVPPEDHLQGEADQLARALGLEEDTEAKTALLQFGKRIGGYATQAAQEADSRSRRLAATVDYLLLRQAVGELAGDYPQLKSDPSALDSFKEKVRALTKDEAYRGKLQELFADAAMLAFKDAPRSKKNGKKGPKVGGRNRRAGRPSTTTRAERRKTPPKHGSREHQWEVFKAIKDKRRQRLAGSRR